MTITARRAVPAARRARILIEPHWRALGPGLVIVALFGLWVVHDGGYDSDTWYWGALLLLGMVAALLVSGGWPRIAASRTSVAAIAAFAAYVAWSYASIAWAQSAGDALQGSNRALLYLLVFTLMLALPWTAEGALAALVAFALVVGIVGVVILLRLGSADRVSDLLADGRLASPTGYFNSTVGLFSMGGLLSIVLASRRELPGLLRGVLTAFGAIGLQLALIGQSRGWLFTLPIVLILTLLTVRDRLRVLAAAALPTAAAVIPVHTLIASYATTDSAQLNHAASQAGRIALLLSAGVLVLGTLLAWAETLARPPALSRRTKRLVGGVLAAGVLGLGFAGSMVATRGHLFHYVSREWRGFSHPPTADATSHFATVGSGRYDVWRVSLDAAIANPIGGLGQDNFGDYYVSRRRTSEEPSWTHSFEMRLLAHTGFVGFGLFAAFLAFALTGVWRVRRHGSALASAAAGVALVPLIVWLTHGSVDWFWEVPALSGPALGFMAVAMALGRQRRAAGEVGAPRAPWIPRPVWLGAGAILLLALVVVLGFPYLSVREVSMASDLRDRNPAAALRDLTHAGALNPLTSTPGRLGGTIALASGRLIEAENRFQQAIDREPGGWYSWFGDGLAASALGDSARARHDFAVAASINSRQPVVKTALARVDTTHPLTPSAALSMLVLVH